MICHYRTFSGLTQGGLDRGWWTRCTRQLPSANRLPGRSGISGPGSTVAMGEGSVATRPVWRRPATQTSWPGSSDETAGWVRWAGLVSRRSVDGYSGPSRAGYGEAPCWISESSDAATGHLDFTGSFTTGGVYVDQSAEVSGVMSWEQYRQVFDAIMRSNGWDDATAALQLLSHLEGDAFNVALLVPAARRAMRVGLVGALTEHYGWLPQTVWTKDPHSRGRPLYFCDRIRVKAFGDMGQTVQLRIICDRFIAGHGSCELRRHVDSVSPETPIRDIVDRLVVRCRRVMPIRTLGNSVSRDLREHCW